MRLLIATVALSATLAAPALADHGASARSTSFKRCGAPAAFPEEGGSFTSLSAGSGVKCTTAASVATAWAKCAAANGKGGRCVKKVKGYGCGDTATTVGTTRTSRVTCKKKKAIVKFGVSRAV
jgi:hypothetical protein